MPDGTKRVETAPLPATGPIQGHETLLGRRRVPCRRLAHGRDQRGLQECTEAYARPGTCRASSYGTKKMSRLWVVKAGGHWLQCQYPDLGSKCVDMFARPPANLPFDAVQ